MKHSVHILGFLFLANTASAGAFEEKYGIGVVHISPYNYFSLDFWKKPGDVVPAERIYFYRDSASTRLHFHSATAGTDTMPSWFAPELFLITPDFTRIDMRCVEREGNWCKVIVNNHGDTKWIELGIDVEFFDWGKFYTSMASVEIIAGKPALYGKPVAKGKSVKLKTKAEAGAMQLLRPLSVQGEWMEVEAITRDENGNETGKRTGWIRWRDSETLFITYNVFNC